jgi:hypothetical protein
MAIFRKNSSSSVIEVWTETANIVSVQEKTYTDGNIHEVLLTADEAVFVVAELSKFIEEAQEREKAWK